MTAADEQVLARPMLRVGVVLIVLAAAVFAVAWFGEA